MIGTILGLISSLLGVADKIIRHFEKKKEIDQAVAARAYETIRESRNALDEVLAARRSVKHDADSVRNDPANRDSWD